MERVEVKPSKLPLEILRMIFLKIDEDNPIEELKKCRLVSPRFYKAVQDLFQDEFVQKLCIQFDGSKYNYTKCRTFGMNIFGSYKLNFPTVKISRSEYYLMKSWLEKLIPTNLQTLELKDNRLNWKELILVLKKFSSIINLKFLQTSEDMEVAEQIFQLFQIKFEPNTGGYRAKIKEQFAKSEIFLPNLKSFEAQIVHIRILNILSFIISRARCQLESFSIIMDLIGVSQSSEVPNLRPTLDPATEEGIMNGHKFTLLHIRSLNHFRKFSKWLKNLQIKILFSKEQRYRYLKLNHSLKFPSFYGYWLLYKSILRMFLKPHKLKKYTNIENFEIKMSTSDTNHDEMFSVMFFDEKHKIGLFEFVKNQKNLQKFALSPLIYAPRDHEGIPRIQDILKNLMITSKSTFKYFASSFEPILGFTENLAKLRIDQTIWCDPKIPVFRNCTSLTASNTRWDDFLFRNMIEKLPNLNKLAINLQYNEDLQIPTINTNDDLQLIIKHYKDLKLLQIDNLEHLHDSGLTGLSLEAIEARKENLELPIESEDRIGFPISRLKNLESLTIRNEFYDDNPYEISDVSAHHAFNNMPKLRYLNFLNTLVTRNGFETILAKSKSKNLDILQLRPTNSDSDDD